MAEKKLKAGEILFNEGDVADVAYIVISGTIELFYTTHGTETKSGTVNAGHILGELAVFDSQALRQTTARAVDDVVLKSIAPEEFKDCIAKCPADIQPFIKFAFDKIAAVKNKNKTPAENVSKGDVASITVSPVGEKMKAQFKPMEVTTNNLPFRIGGYPEGGERNRRDQLHLALASPHNPLQISRQHCEITLENDELILSDLGSRFGTTVNGVTIGRGRGIYIAPLKKGNNEITLGNPELKYQITVKC